MPGFEKLFTYPYYGYLNFQLFWILRRFNYILWWFHWYCEQNEYRTEYEANGGATDRIQAKKSHRNLPHNSLLSQNSFSFQHLLSCELFVMFCTLMLGWRLGFLMMLSNCVIWKIHWYSCHLLKFTFWANWANYRYFSNDI